MTLLILKKLGRNIKNIKLRNLTVFFSVKGTRTAGSVVLPLGKLSCKIADSAVINIADGDLLLNSFFTKPDPYPGVLKMKNNSKIEVKNTFTVHSGCNISVMENAVLKLGSGYINSHVKIRCFKEISIGLNVSISENVTIWDSDAHQIIGSRGEMIQPVKIGDNVWIGNNVIILKGVTIGNGSVIAAGSVVNKNIPDNCLAGGVPAKVIRENIQWK